MKKLNTKVILLSFAITAVLLFGGWFGLQFFNIEKPIRNWFTEHEGIDLQQLQVNQKQVEATVMFTDPNHFASNFLEFEQFLTQIGKGKELTIKIAEGQNESHPWWLEHSPQILETLTHQQYRQLVSIIDEWRSTGLLADGKVFMNSKMVFIYLQPIDDTALYLLFPLEKEKGGGDRG